MFNLEQSIAKWRRQMLAVGIKTPVPLDELESQLRDDVEQQVQSGLNAQPAFQAAALRIGLAGVLKLEFIKVGETREVLQRKMVWALLGVAFLSCWFEFGPSLALALVYGVGAGLMYFILRAGKLAFGRQRLAVTGETKIIFTNTEPFLPEKEIPCDELFYRKSDAIELHARSVDLGNRIYKDTCIRLTPKSPQISDDKFDPEKIPHIETLSSEVFIPREAMGFDDVKFMAPVGALLGWQAVIFSLIASSFIGSLIGVGLMAARRSEGSSRLPYGPYIALAATIWIFGGKNILDALFAR